MDDNEENLCPKCGKPGRKVYDDKFLTSYNCPDPGCTTTYPPAAYTDQVAALSVRYRTHHTQWMIRKPYWDEYMKRFVQNLRLNRKLPEE